MPPPILFKYLPPERVDVFERRMVSFTPPSRFNDILEFSLGTQTLLGPRFREQLFGRVDDLVAPDHILQLMFERGLIRPPIDTSWVLREIERLLPQLRQHVAMSLSLNADRFLSELNEMHDAGLLRHAAEKTGIGVLCLTDDPYNAVMWSHYARDYSGIVLAFDAFNPWFWFDENHTKPRPVRVVYDDRVLEELASLAESDLVPFARKRSVWAYEHEWRIFESLKDRTLHIEANDVSLFEIPADAFLGVLIGFNTPAEISMRIMRHKVMHMPHVWLKMVRPNHGRGQLEFVPIGDD